MRMPGDSPCLHVCPGQAVLRCEFCKQFNLDKLHLGTTGRTAMRSPRPGLVSHILPAELSCDANSASNPAPRNKLFCDANSARNLVLIGSAEPRGVESRCECRGTAHVSMFVRARLS